MGSIQPAPVGEFQEDLVLMSVAYEFDKEVVNLLETKFPGLKTYWHCAKNGRLKVEDIPAEIWANTTILWTFEIPRDAVLPKLRFVQLSSAGADHWAESPYYLNPNINFCTSNGVHPPQIAEWVIGSWLSHQHQFPKYSDYMKSGYWEPVHVASFQDSHGLRMGILGYGAIGRQCGNLARALGMDVVAFTARERLTAESRKDDSYCVPGTGDPDGLIPSRWFHGYTQQDLNNFLDQDLDLLVICIPLTASSRNMISKQQFEILAKKKTFVSNVGRGGLINTDDLIEALEQGMIRGAAVDVTNPEPLPQDHPLWKAPNLLITPHVSWVTINHLPRTLAIFETNVTALRTGTEFVNLVNKERHY